MKFRLLLSSLLLLSIQSLGKTQDFVGRVSEIEIFLKKNEGWSSKELEKKEIHLSESPDKKGWAFTSKLECGTRTCTTYLFESTGKDRYQWVGTTNGAPEVLTEADHQHYRLKTTTSMGGGPNESLEVIYHFNGQMYEPQAGAKSAK